MSHLHLVLHQKYTTRRVKVTAHGFSWYSLFRYVSYTIGFLLRISRTTSSLLRLISPEHLVAAHCNFKMLFTISSKLLLLSFAALSLCRPVAKGSSMTFAEGDSVDSLPAGWTYYGPAEDTAPVHLRIALAYTSADQNDDDDSTFQTPSDYASYGYGRYLNTEESAAYTPSLQPTIEIVRRWLVSQGIVKTTVDRDWLNFDTTVNKANSLIHAEFGYYRYHGGSPVLRSMAYSISSDVLENISYISPVTDFETGS